MKRSWKNGIITILKKTGQLVLSLFLLSLVVFCMARLAPGDPLKAYYGEGVERMSVSQRAAAMERLGLDRSLPVQYGAWIKNALHGEFGMSFQYKRDVFTVIGGVYQNTLLLGVTAYLLTFLLALPLGAYLAAREGSRIDRILCRIGAGVNCIPSFWIALVLILIFSVWLKLFPSGGAYAAGQAGNPLDRLWHLILPLAVLVLGHLWYYACMVRNKLLEEIRKDYVLLCRMKGLSRTATIWGHCMRSCMPALVSMMAASVAHILGGTYIVEQVFSYPGLGTLCFESAKYHDYNLLMVLSLLTGAAVILANLFAQMVSDRIYPEMRRNRRGND